MRRILLSCFCLMAALAVAPTVTMTAAPARSSSVAAVRRTTTDTISVPGMQCESCERRITKKLKGVKGITSVVATASQKQVIVTYHPDQIDRKALEQRIADSGYDAGSATATVTAKTALPSCCRVKE